MKVIGLTGGIASGKSTVARMLEKLGATIVDADQLAREIVAPGSPLLKEIRHHFGPHAFHPDGTLDRAALGAIVFVDPYARQQLEAITHPAIKQLALQRLNELKEKGADIVFYMAPLLIEAGSTDRVDSIWLVDVNLEIQLQRVQERDGLSRDAAMKRISSQMPTEEKKKFATLVIDNNGSLEETERQIKEAFQNVA